MTGLLDDIAEEFGVGPDDEMVGGIRFENFEAVLNEGVPDPAVLIDDVLYEVGIHLVSGHPGDGKTSWCMHLAWMAMAEGRHVVWLDYEGGLKPTLRRALAVGIPPALLLSHFHYAAFPDAAEQHLDAVADRWSECLVIFDSLSKALSYASVDENSPGEVTKYMVPVVKACIKRELPLIIIDHVSRAGGGKYSRGAGSKLADVMVHWGVEKTADFSRSVRGSITVHQLKDREGCLPFATHWTMGDGEGRLTILPTDAPPASSSPDEGPAI